MASRGRRSNGLVILARIVISLVAIFYGVENALHPVNVPVVPLERLMPSWIPGHLFIAWLTGAVMITTGACILVGKKMRTAAAWLGAFILLIVLVVYLPIMIGTMSAASVSEQIEGLNYFADTLFFGGTVLALAGALPRETLTGTAD
jgi:uncharacterized membrane protein YphA (DoxX/SURF4 family)